MATDEALRVTEFVAAVPAVMDTISVPMAEHVTEFPVVWSFSTTNRWFISFHQTLDPVVCRVHLEQPVAAEKIRRIVHGTVVWSQVLLQAIPQVQVVESM